MSRIPPQLDYRPTDTVLPVGLHWNGDELVLVIAPRPWDHRLIAWGFWLLPLGAAALVLWAAVGALHRTPGMRGAVIVTALAAGFAGLLWLVVSFLRREDGCLVVRADRAGLRISDPLRVLSDYVLRRDAVDVVTRVRHPWRRPPVWDVSVVAVMPHWGGNSQQARPEPVVLAEYASREEADAVTAALRVALGLTPPESAAGAGKSPAAPDPLLHVRPTGLPLR